MTEDKARGSTVDAEDVARFDRIGEEWWDPKGKMAALHAFNPIRIGYLRDLLCRHFPQESGRPRDRRTDQPLTGLRLLDIGCGAGLLAEPLARLGAIVTAIDPAPRNIEVARAHAAKSGLSIDYRCQRVEDLALDVPFDAVLTMEVLEHVADVPEFLRRASALVRPGGLLVAATLNRTLKSFALAIVGAEYILRWVEPGTHDWRQFITPDELTRMVRANGLSVIDRTGAVYDPLRTQWRLSHNLDINYMLAARR